MAQPLKIVFHAVAVGPGQDEALCLVESMFSSHVVTCHLGGPLGNLNLLVANPDVVVLAVSPSKNESEIELLEAAHSLGKSVVVIADVPEAWRRPAIKPHLKKVHSVVVTHPMEVALAKEWGYPRANFLGYSPKWGRFLERAEPFDLVRARISKSKDGGRAYPLSRWDALFTIGGTKNGPLADSMLEAVVAAGRQRFGDNFVVAPRYHPREEIPGDNEFREHILRGLWVADTSAFTSLDAMILGSNFLISSGGATAFLYSALTDEGPLTIYYEDPVSRADMTRQIDKETWLPIEQGIAEVASSTDELTRRIVGLTDPEGDQELRASRRAFFSPEEVKRMRAGLTEIQVVRYLIEQFRV